MKKFLILMMSLALVLAVVIGCSDDDENTPTDPNGLETGSLDDPELGLAQEALYNADDFSGELFTWMGFFIDSVLGEASQQSSSSSFVAKLASDSVFATYHDGSEYWYMYFRNIDTLFGNGVILDIITVTLYDSIQFLHSGDPVQWPDSSLLTGIINGAALVITTQNGFDDAFAAQNVTVVGAPGAIANKNDVTFNGTRTFEFGITDESGDCSLGLNATTTLTDLLMNIAYVDEGGCPEDGNLLHTATITIECTGDTTFSFSDTWTFDQTFDGDTIHVVVENSTTRWTFTDTCDVPIVTARPYAEIFDRIREK